MWRCAIKALSDTDIIFYDLKGSFAFINTLDLHNSVTQKSR